MRDEREKLCNAFIGIELLITRESGFSSEMSYTKGNKLIYKMNINVKSYI